MCANRHTVVTESGYLAATGSLFLHRYSVTNLAALRMVLYEGNGRGPLLTPSMRAEVSGAAGPLGEKCSSTGQCASGFPTVVGLTWESIHQSETGR